MSSGARRPLSRAGALFVVLVSLLAVALVAAELRLEPNVASLLPDAGEAASLRRYVGAFGGTDLGVVLVRGESPENVEQAAAAVAEGLRAQPSVRSAADRVPLGSGLAPLLAFRHADLAGQARLRQLLTPEGMRARLAETRRLLLGPGSGALAETLAADPLRLVQAAFEGRSGSGFATQADGSFATDDGHARLVLVEPKGKALVSADAKAFVADAERVLSDVGRAQPGVTLGLTGGHAIAAATEAMLRRDFALSGSLSLGLASLAFLLTFRRLRALVAVMPPLVLGSLWTAAVASSLPGGLSAIAIAFMSVVIGVGVDTGVHVYAALLEGRRNGLSSNDSALAARRRLAKPVLLAAATAAAAFASLGLSQIGAVRQLGLLCAAGELLTAVAILLVTPALGALLERGPALPSPEPAWTRRVAALTSTRGRALLVALFAVAPLALVGLGAGPSFSSSIVAIRPAGLAPLAVQSEVFAAFGGAEGQWVVLVADTEQEHARARADRLAERLGTVPQLVRSVDALTTLAPAESTQRERLANRDALGLPARAEELERALTETGFATSRFSAALAAFRAPPSEHVSLADVRRGGAGILLGRYLGEDAGEQLVALYVQPQPGEAAAEALVAFIRGVEPAALVTGYARLESALRATLVEDLPRIGGAAALLVLGVLIFSLRRPRDVALAALVVAVELAAVLLAVRVTGVPLHAYSALVIPLLVGITVDEGVFLLHRVREAGGEDVAREALAHEGPIVAATGLTTAAGFGALALCDFDGLRHLGIVGALGSAMGLAIALLVVPAGVRLFPRK